MNLKKKLISAALSAGLLVFQGCSDYSKIHKYEFPSLSWGLVNIEKPRCLMDIKIEINAKIKPKKDPPFQDIWNSPKKTIELKYGDCDDIALYVSYRAEQLGYPPKVLDLKGFNKESGKRVFHWASLIEHKHSDGRIEYGSIEQWRYLFEEEFDGISPESRIFHGYDSIEELVARINETDGKTLYNYYKVIDLNQLGKDWRTTKRNLWNYEIANPSGYKAINVIK